MPPGRVLVPDSGQCRARATASPATTQRARTESSGWASRQIAGLDPRGPRATWASYAWPRRWSCFSIEAARRLRGPRRLAQQAAPTPQRRAGHPRRGRRRVGRGARRRPRPRRQPRPRARPRPGRTAPGRPRPPAPRLRPRAPRSLRQLRLGRLTGRGGGVLLSARRRASLRRRFWALADPAFRAQLRGYRDFQAGQANDRSITFDSAHVASQAGKSATVRVSTTSVQSDGTHHCSGTVDLVQGTAGHWLVHQIDINCS